MKILQIILIVSALASCNRGGESKSERVTVRETRYRQLLSKFKEVNFDTLKIYSPQDLEGEFKGVELDSVDIIKLSGEIAEQHFRDPQGVFAIYKFEVDSNVTGLLVRTPSEYVPSSIKLFFFNDSNDTISGYVELAESFGDAGDYMTKNSWLFKMSNQKIAAFVWTNEGHDNSVDDPNDTTIDEWNYYYLLDLTGQGIDTVSTDSSELSKTFSHLVQNNNKNLPK